MKAKMGDGAPMTGFEAVMFFTMAFWPFISSILMIAIMHMITHRGIVLFSIPPTWVIYFIYMNLLIDDLTRPWLMLVFFFIFAIFPSLLALTGALLIL